VTIIEGVISIFRHSLESKVQENLMKNNNYVPKGSPVTFSVTGKSAFMGLLLYAVDSQKNHVGTWNTPTGFKILTSPQCQGDPSGTLSHADSNLKGPNVNFMWTPPSTNVGQISFVGTIVQSGEAGFEIIRFPTNFTASGGGNFVAPSSPSNSTSPTSSDSSNPSNSATTDPSTTTTHSDASSFTRSALLLQLTAAISLLFYYL